MDIGRAINFAKDVGKGLANAGVDVANFAYKVITLNAGDTREIPLPFPDGSATTKVVQFAVPLAIPGAGEEEVAGRGLTSLENVAKDSSLTTRAQEIHSTLDPIAQKMRTTAVGDVTDANGARQTLVSSSERALTPAQRSSLRAGEVAISGQKGVHAEQKIMDHAATNGQTVKAIAPSRPPCGDCATNAANRGITIVPNRNSQ